MALERPKEHAVRRLVTLILGGDLPLGSALPPERELAESIGVTRPTLREALQRLVSEGWITIAHGKSTVVNDYWRQGGLGILRSIVQYSEEIPGDVVRGLLELRRQLVPLGAAEAARRSPQVLLDYLSSAGELADDAADFARFDWELQRLLAWLSGNRILPLMFNDFETLYERIGGAYFSDPEIRRETTGYYDRLAEAFEVTGRGPARSSPRRWTAASGSSPTRLEPTT